VGLSRIYPGEHYLFDGLAAPSGKRNECLVMPFSLAIFRA
jgi:hypothetical protein